jgi:hypothetical protein
MIAEQILNILESKIFIEFPEATDEEIEMTIKKRNLKNGTITGADVMFSSSSSPEAECCALTACSGGLGCEG